PQSRLAGNAGLQPGFSSGLGRVEGRGAGLEPGVPGVSRARQRAVVLARRGFIARDSPAPTRALELGKDAARPGAPRGAKRLHRPCGGFSELERPTPTRRARPPAPMRGHRRARSRVPPVVPTKASSLEPHRTPRA